MKPDKQQFSTLAFLYQERCIKKSCIYAETLQMVNYNCKRTAKIIIIRKMTELMFSELGETIWNRVHNYTTTSEQSEASGIFQVALEND